MAVLSVFLCFVALCDMLRNAISIHVTALPRDSWQSWHVERAGISLQFASVFAELKTNKDTRYKQTYCRPDHILDRTDIWVDFERFAVSLWELDPPVHISEARSNTQKPRYEFFSDKNWCNIDVSLWDLRLPKLNVLWLKHLFEYWFMSCRTSRLSRQKDQISLKCSLNFAFP